MSNTVGKLNVKIEADNQGLQSGLNKAEQQVQKSAQKMQRSIEKNVKFGAGMAKGLAAMGALEAGLKGVMAISKAFKGDIDGVNEALAQMPFGIGPVASAVQGLAMEWYGVAEAQEAANKASAQHLKNVKAQRGAGSLIAQLEGKIDMGGTKDAGRRKEKQAILEHKATARRIAELSSSGKLQKGQADRMVKLNDMRLQQVFDQVKEADQDKRKSGFIKHEKALADKAEASDKLKKGALAKLAREDTATKGGAADLIARLSGQAKLGSLSGKDRAIEQARQTMEATIKSVDKLVIGGGKFKQGQPEEIKQLAAKIFEQQVAEINKVKTIKKSATATVGSEAGFESVGLTRSRLSGRGGPLDIVTEKPPTMRGQATANSLLMKIAENTRGANAAVAG